jgi:hypothetical protein
VRKGGGAQLSRLQSPDLVAWALEAHGFGGYVGVFQAGAGVEEEGAVGGFQVAAGQQAVVAGAK